MNRRDRDYLTDILDAARLIRNFVQDMDQETFGKDIKSQSAVIRQLEIIGEATKRISRQLKEDHPHIPWKRLAGMRDVFIHAYHRVDIDEVWDTATTLIPDLISQLEPLVPSNE